MGTSSLGWAVTDTDYRLLRAKGKDLWGVRLFKEAETAVERRTHRTSRRRLQRERARIGFLREIFEQEITKVDSGFYQRLDDSKYLTRDKSEKQPFTLFAGTNYTDKDYYVQYPTIAHLRKELCESCEPHDVRLVFLAILNIYKHRGHFLNSNLDSNGMGSLEEIVKPLYEDIDRLQDVSLCEKLGKILSSQALNNSKKYEEILKLFELDKKSYVAEMIKFICGLSGIISKAFPMNEYDEENVKKKLSFRDGNYDEKIIDIERILSEEDFEKLIVLKQIHDWGILANLMHDGVKTLSQARVLSYEKHHKDLKILQEVYRKYIPEEYDKMFRMMEDNSYSAYVGSVNSKLAKTRRGGKCSTEDFYKRIKNSLPKIEDSDIDYILSEIEKGSFLPKQMTNSNGVIPNQLHGIELRLILKNAETYLTFLEEKDETGLTNSEKIIQMFEFNIPYYVGPLFNDGKHSAWSVRKSEGKVFPWNFDEKVDVKKSAEEFINRMVNHCTYLDNEQVLPKNSLMYEKFMVLNELNNLCINGEKITVALKKQIYNDLLIKGKKVTGKKIVEYVKKKGLVSAGDEVEITGIDGDLTNTLANYAKFRDVFKTEILTYEQEIIAEKIIFWSTVYGDSKKFLRDRIQEEYKDIFSKEKIKRILGYKFKDWGRLSKAVLELEGADRQTGEIKSIISRMWDENYNFMQLLSTDFTYLEALEERQTKVEKLFSELEYEDLQEFNLSPPVKRMVWQTMLVIKELCDVLGNEPKRIFVEMARESNAPKERKESRKRKFEELYKKCKEDGRNWSEEIKNREETEFRSKKLYLYYTQKGRCMYTGEPIDLDDLFNDNLYDIDHIYPRHFVKDDSIENNLVLVRKEENAHKSDAFPLEHNIQRKCRGLWKILLDGGFITKEKFARLTRTNDFSDAERATFISRQLVETRQGTKTIATIFKTVFENSDIVYVKADNVSHFRKKYDLIKCRDVNDFHHANDAYLNIVVGNTYYIKFTSNPINFIREYRKNPSNNEYHMYKLFDYKVSRGDDVAWVVDGNHSIGIVKKTMSKTTPLVTRMNYEESGGLADQTIYSAKEAAKVKGEGYIPIKATDEKLADVCTYGGLKKYTGTYFFLVEHGSDRKRIRTIEAVPLYLKNQLGTKEKLEDYACEKLQLINPRVCYPRIKMYSLIKVEGFYLYLTGRTGNHLFVSNAVQMVLDYESQYYIKKFILLCADKKNDEQLEKYGISRKDNLRLYDLLVEKHREQIYSRRPNPVGNKLKDWRNKFVELSIQEQIYVLNQILQLSQGSNMGADLKSIGGVQKTGVMTLNKKITDKCEFKLINISPAGLYRNEIDLLTI